MIFLAMLSTIGVSAWGGDPPRTCFDFNQVVSKPLVERIPTRPGGDAFKSGTVKGSKEVWGSTRGMVSKPIRDVLTQLLDHTTIKDPKKVKLRVYEQERPGYVNFHLVMLEANPLPLIHVSWEEEWAYAITRGTAQAPQQVVISYQKTSGTKYLNKLCGSIVLEEVGASRTDVFLHEELHAFGRRSAEDTGKSQAGTLRTLRGKASPSRLSNTAS